MSDLYDPAAVKKLFDEMSDSYQRVNYLASFGFSARWRRQFLTRGRVAGAKSVADFMCGQGESWPYLFPLLPENTRIIAIDFSSGMLRDAKKAAARYPNRNIDLRQGDVLTTNLPDASVDAVFCGFGLKTLSAAQQQQFAHEIARVLRPTGTFSLVEVSVPPAIWLRWVYMFYLKSIVPILGQLLLGNPDNYRQLGIYTEAFRNSSLMADYLRDAGLQAQYDTYFYGCASGVSGIKLA